MTVDIAKARAREQEKRQRYFGNVEAADTIAALLDENRKAWTSVSETSLRLAEVLKERDALAREVDACAAALPGPYYMDPPDGGDVPISEQVKRMARDAARWRMANKLRQARLQALDYLVPGICIHG